MQICDISLIKKCHMKKYFQRLEQDDLEDYEKLKSKTTL